MKSPPRTRRCQSAAASDEATARSTPTTIESDSSGGIRVTALTYERAPTEAAACTASPYSSSPAPLHGLDQIITLLVGCHPVSPSSVVTYQSCFGEGCSVVREHRHSQYDQTTQRQQSFGHASLLGCGTAERLSIPHRLQARKTGFSSGAGTGPTVSRGSHKACRRRVGVNKTLNGQI